MNIKKYRLFYKLLLTAMLVVPAYSSMEEGASIPRKQSLVLEDPMLARQKAELRLKTQVDELVTRAIPSDVLNAESKNYVLNYLNVRTPQGIRTLEEKSHSSLAQMLESGMYNGIFDKNFFRARQLIMDNINAKEINLAGYNLKALPSEIGQMPNLEKLDLSNNAIKTLPLNMEGLKHLKDLNLKNNRIDRLPISIGELKGLEMLNLSNNKLEALPRSLLSLGASMKELDISGNNFNFNSEAGKTGLKELKGRLRSAKILAEGQSLAVHRLDRRGIIMRENPSIIEDYSPSDVPEIKLNPPARIVHEEPAHIVDYSPSGEPDIKLNPPARPGEQAPSKSAFKAGTDAIWSSLPGLPWPLKK